MDHDFGTLTTAINPRDDNSSQDEAVEQNTDKIHGHNIVSSSSDNRKTISVVIDEDEYDTDLSTSFASIKSPTEQYFYGSFTPYSDHNYIIGNQRPRSSNSNFPVIEGLNLEVIEDSSTNLPRAQTFRPLTKRYASYAYDQEDGNAFYSGSSAYYRNQIRENPEERLTHQKPQYGLPHSTRRQQVTSSEHLPLASHSLSRSRFVPTSESPYSPINQINRGSLPPQRSHGGMHIDSSYLIDGSPAPIVTATRGRPSIGRNKFARIAQDEHLYNQNIILTKDSGDQTRYILPMHTGFPSEQQKKQLPESRQQQRFRQLQKRNISVHPSSRNDIHQHYDEQKTEDQQRHDYLEEEEMLNEDFFAQQHQKYSQQQQSSDLERNIQTRVRNDTITPSDPIQSLNTSPNLLDTSKPPDDPYLPPQQAPQYSGMEIQNRQFSNQQQLHYPPGFDTSAIDGTINSVVRGEASVMQQHFGPPISCATSDDLSYSSTFQRQNIEPQQQDLNYDQQSLQIPESIDMFYPQEHLAKQRPMSSHSVFSHGLDELAKASSTLLDHSTATSSDRMADHQQLPELVSRTKSHNQAQFNQAPGQQSQTLHFKVVQTSHRDEPSSLSQNQDYVQQVFTVQQQQRQKTVDSAPFDLPRPDQYRTFSASRALPQVRQNVGSGRRQRSTALSPVSIASNGGIEAEEPEFQQMGDFTKPMKWQRSFRKQLPEEVEAKDASSIPVRASNANESLVIEPKKRGRISKRNKNELEQQEGFDYITRCICGMKHNDPFMIQCDRCDVWQHGICMSVRENSVPDTYLCELCQPRSLGLTPKQAKSIQVRSLIAAKAPKPKKNKSLPTIKYRSKTPALSAALKITSKIRRTKLGADSILKKGGISKRKDVMRSSFANVNVKAATKRQKHLKKETSFPVQNQYSRGIRSLMSNMQPYVLGELGLLRRLDHTPLARPMLVAPNIEGLVATPGKNSNIPMGMPIVEYTGAISLLSEVKNKAMNREHGHKFTLVYSGFTDHEKVFIDASKLGSIARSVRRSCRPNATLQHAIVDGQLRIYLYAAMNIDRSSEVTIPFDYDYRESSEPVECACNTLLGMGDMEHCPIFTYNKSLQSNLNNKMHRDKSIASSPRRFVSPRKTRNSTSSPITVKAEAVPASKLDVQKSSDEHKKLSDDPLPAIQPKRRSPRTTCLIEAKIPKLELANSPTSNDPNIDDEKSLSRNSLSSSLIASTKSFSQTSQTRSLRSNASQFMGQIKWGDKPPPNKRNDPSSVSSSSYLQSNKTSRRLSDNPTSPRLVTLKKSKDEIVVNGDGNFTREERKLQATIASIERAEHLSHEKKRKQNEKIHPPSEPPIAIKLKRKSYNIKTSTKAVQDDSICINFRRLFDELARILQMKFKNWQEFKLPPSFDDLRTELVEKSQVAEKPDNINNAKKAEGSSNVKIRGVPTTSKAPISDNEETINNQKMISPTINECVCQKQQLDGGSLNLSLSIPEIDKDIKTVSAPPSTVNSPTDTSDVEKPDRESVIDGNSETVIRPPNTKAHKKLTLEEYKRKKKAEMEAKQKQISGDDVSTEKTTSFQEHLSSSLYPHSSSAFSSTSLTRHSPRKSFIPAINSLPSSPPQQLEDLPSISSIGGRHKQKLFNTPSLDELKKRIHGESFSRSCGSSSGERLEPRSHPSSPSDMPPPPPPPKNRPLPERLSMTLDDRLKKLVKRTT